MSFQVQVLKRGGLVSLDVSQENDQKEILRILEDDGWVILKDVTHLNSSEEAKLNKYVLAFLDAARSGEFDHSAPRHWLYPYLINAPIIRPSNWQDLAREKELLAVACYHLGGGQDVQWHWEYDKGLRGDETKETEVVEARGQDIIIYNGWLAQRFPKPDKAMDMIMVKHRWTGFEWTDKSR